MYDPDEHTSLAPQTVPFGWFDQAEELVPGLQAWQPLAGFTVPAGRRAPPIKQSALHDPDEHTSLPAQTVPSGSLDQVVALMPGVQT